MNVEPRLQDSIARMLDEREKCSSAVAESLADMRQRSLIDVSITSEPVLEGFTLEERSVAPSKRDVRVRVYRPEATDDGPLPTLLWYPGGGFVLGGPHTLADLCAGLCVEAGIQVVCTSYALGPEHRWPEGHDDAFESLEWLMEVAPGVDTTRVLVGGDSAGGHVAAHAALRWRGKGMPLIGQLLIYPVVGSERSSDSYHRFAEGYGLTAADMEWFFEQYGPLDAPAEVPFDLLAVESLAGACPAYVVTAECDVLRDEGEKYAAALNRAGVHVNAARYEGMPHGFFQMTRISETSRAAVSECAQHLRGATA